MARDKPDDAAMRWIGAGLLGLACSLASGCHDRVVGGDEVRWLLSDTTVAGAHLRDHYHFVRHYHADGTFEQVEGPQGSGRWRVNVDAICIRWDRPYPKSGELCRYMKTDDAGGYWKEFENARGRTIKVVTYDSFVGADGRDRRTIVGFWRRNLTTLAVGGLLLFTLLAALLILGADQPHSLRNMLRRRLFPLRAGHLEYSYRELCTLDAERQASFLIACCRHGRRIEASWAADCLFAGRSHDEACAALWKAIEPLDDATAKSAIARAMAHFAAPAAVIAATGGAIRFAYLAGQAHQEKATSYAKSNKVQFEAEKQVALAYYEHVRSRQPTPPPEVSELAAADPYRHSPYQVSDDADYAKLVVPAYEAMMYMAYTGSTRSHRSSSSHAGGG